MCQFCVEIDERIEGYRKVLRSMTEPAEIEPINQLIAEL